MILFSVISVSQTPQSHVLPSLLARASGKPVFLTLTSGSPGKRLACVAAQKVRAATFMCYDGSDHDRRRIYQSGEEWWRGKPCEGRSVAEASRGDDIFILLSSQLLYSTYLLSCARRTIGVDEGLSWEVHHRILPAFEELFDEVEEHALNVLLEPWTLLLHQDTESFQKVTPVLLFHVQGDIVAEISWWKQQSFKTVSCAPQTTLEPFFFY